MSEKKDTLLSEQWLGDWIFLLLSSVECQAKEFKFCREWQRELWPLRYK